MRSEIVRHGLAVVALCLLTVFSLHAPWRFAANAPILALGTGDDIPESWYLSEDGFSPQPFSGREKIVLDAGSSPAVPYLTVVRLDVPAAEHLEVAVDLEIVGLKPGRDPWQRAEVVMVSFDKSLRPIGYWPVKVMSIAQEQTMRRVSAIFPVHPETSALRLLVYNGAARGTLGIGAVSVAPLTEHAVFVGMRSLAVVLWGAYLGVAAWRVSRLEGNGWMKGLFLALACVTAVGVLTPQPYYGVVVAHVERLADIVRYGLPPALPTAPPHAPGQEGTDSRETPEAKRDEGPAAQQESDQTPARTESDPGSDSNSPTISGPLPTIGYYPDRPGSLVDWILDRVTVKQAGHFSMFLLLAVAALLAFPASPVWSVAVFLVAFAGASEILQLFLATRGSSIFDFFLNLGGLALGMSLVWGARLTGRARRRYV